MIGYTVIGAMIFWKEATVDRTLISSAITTRGLFIEQHIRRLDDLLV
jgi:hypothetical protein